MRCNAAGRAIIEQDEGFSTDPYLDPNGIPTQGYGHTAGVTMQSQPCTKEIADQWLENDLANAESAINAFVKQPLTSNQFSALCSLVFNIGAGNFERSGLLHVINNGDLDLAPNHIQQWDRDHNGVVLRGLMLRRMQEVNLWNTPEESDDLDAA